MWSDDGTLSDQTIQNLIRNKRYKLTLESFLNATIFTSASLHEHLAYAPVYIAFTGTSSGKKTYQCKLLNDRIRKYCATIHNGTASRCYFLDDAGFHTGIYIGKPHTKPLSEFNTFGSVYVGSLM